MATFDWAALLKLLMIVIQAIIDLFVTRPAADITKAEVVAKVRAVVASTEWPEIPSDEMVSLAVDSVMAIKDDPNGILDKWGYIKGPDEGRFR